MTQVEHLLKSLSNADTCAERVRAARERRFLAVQLGRLEHRRAGLTNPDAERESLEQAITEVAFRLGYQL